uniref:U37-Eretoxin-Ek1j_1 n=1 Tax=Eresus cinnaberinus TaxID=175337 RepID=A0A2D0PD48_ERECI
MQLLFGFLFCSLVVLTYAQNKKLLLQKPSNDDSEILLIITWTNDPQQIEHCEIYSDEAVIKNALQEAGEDQVSKPSVQEMKDTPTRLHTISPQQGRNFSH